jgi:hypothetical protein
MVDKLAASNLEVFFKKTLSLEKKTAEAPRKPTEPSSKNPLLKKAKVTASTVTAGKAEVTMAAFNVSEEEEEDQNLLEALQFHELSKDESRLPIENIPTLQDCESDVGKAQGDGRKRKWIKVQKQSFKNGYLGIRGQLFFKLILILNSD